MTTSPAAPPRRPTCRRVLAFAAAGVAALAAAGTSASAQADSIVFVKDANVWLANPDGSGLYQVTTDGTADNPYQSPSQAADGTIVAVRAKPNKGPIIRMRQNGSVIGEITVPVAQYGPFEPAISPDGRYVAYETVFQDTMGVSSDVQYATSEGVTAPGAYPLGGRGTGAPAWIDNDHVLLGNYVQVLTQVPGQQAVNWWSDWDLQPRYFDSSEDLDDGDAAPNGTVAFVRGDRDDNTIQLYQSNGPAALPTPGCVLSNPSPGPLGQRFEDPTFSPSGNAIAWQEGDGIWTTSLTPGDCRASAPKLTIPGASEPDWGPAAVNPGPREAPPVDPPKPTPPSPGARTPPANGPRTATPRTTSPRTSGPGADQPGGPRRGCAAQTGAKRDACVLKAAVARCNAGPKRRRAACVKRARRAVAIKACSRTAKPGKARARCVAKAKRRFR